VGHSDGRVTELAHFLNDQLTHANKKMTGFGQQVAESYGTLQNNVYTISQ
jgi:hypothetical protein